MLKNEGRDNAAMGEDIVEIEAAIRKAGGTVPVEVRGRPVLPRPRPQLVEREERGGLVEEVEGLVEKLGASWFWRAGAKVCLESFSPWGLVATGTWR